MDDDDNIIITISGQALELSPSDMRTLDSFTTHPGYKILQRMLLLMNEGTRKDLEDPETPLDSTRALQGRLSVARQVAELLDEGVPAWISAAKSEPKETD